MTISSSAILLILLIPIVAWSSSIVENLPGFSGALPFKLETGYVGVGENELFYYFIESERDPVTDPLIIWITGGPGCSALSGLVYEIGPMTFNGSSPVLKLNPYSWTKAASIVFVDSPVGTGFSYSTTPQGYQTSDTQTAQDNYSFLKKWLLSHPEFMTNPLFIAGDSYGGKMAILLALLVAQGIEAGVEPRLLLQGYLIGNTVTETAKDYNQRLPYAHRLGLLSDDYYALAKRHCNGEYVNPDPGNMLCNNALHLFQMCLKDVDYAHILEPKCISSSGTVGGLIRLIPNQNDEPECREGTYVSSAIWANDETVRDSLHVRKGTISEWVRCNDSVSYAYDVQTVFHHYRVLIEKGYDGLLYSGDHDMVIPYLATLETVRELNLTLHEAWRPWRVNKQIAGYTQSYKHNGAYVVFATVKGGGHTAPEYRPRECLEMMKRYTSKLPL
ncbi:hypothetical protein M569_01551 [Genlisea aurea]|uniref:Uncharacterized protein n=1 Tax=Genlisea aurea TaxID=192259 RepID=S8D6W6_9LAMI|nr:hypothetical protein M569_01551 [Genlisea aurea]